MNIQSAYHELDVSPDITQAMLKAKYRKLVLELHPDRNDGRNEAQLKRITEAYHMLNDAAQHNVSTHEQRSAQNTRNTRRQEGQTRQRRTMQSQKTPEEDWSRFTSEFEADEAFWKQYEHNFWQDYEKRRADSESQTPNENHDSKRADKDDSTASHTNRTRVTLRHDIHIDESLCIGCCSCETIAPSTFCINKNAKVNPKSSVINSLGDNANTVMDAAETCPTKAIIIDDTLTRQRVYPL